MVANADAPHRVPAMLHPRTSSETIRDATLTTIWRVAKHIRASQPLQYSDRPTAVTPLTQHPSLRIPTPGHGAEPGTNPTP